MFAKNFTRRGSMAALACGAASIAMQDGSAVAAPAAPAGLVVLTVGGLVGAPNRPPSEQKRDRLFYSNNIEFEQARAFSYGDLLSFSPAVVTGLDEAGIAHVYKGPLLHDVLATALPLADAKTARLSALDGFAAELSLDTVYSERWVLALEADGNAFGLGDFGPIYLVRELPAGTKRTEEEEARWVFALYYIDLLA
ncbi:hypothetical protein KKP04_13205 [Rhodomicrobium sp. Az07]|uniref:hypothetical protein n=1 Tax=Rhodomicrobium sp. Az07 TaxID=2839034 RepID=UPI001BE50A11|nr:hypothetical protein [Rhodomicrobium sp. Az07]MBT3071824.1 hypothetical protein [Rhodomicrobium sp. Az07]